MSSRRKRPRVSGGDCVTDDGGATCVGDWSEQADQALDVARAAMAARRRRTRRVGLGILPVWTCDGARASAIRFHHGGALANPPYCKMRQLRRPARYTMFAPKPLNVVGGAAGNDRFELSTK